MKYILKNYGSSQTDFALLLVQTCSMFMIVGLYDRHYYLFNDADFQIKGSLKTPPVTHATSSILTLAQTQHF